MTPQVERRMAKAERLLGQAARQSPEETPEAVIYSAYYSMLHAATAFVEARQGEAPKTHGAVIARFSRLVEDNGDHARSLSRAFNRAEDRRLRADYDEVFIASAAEAAKIRGAAHDFVAYCRTLL